MTDWRSELFSDKTMWSLYRSARRVGVAPLNGVFLTLVVVIMLVFVALNEGSIRRIVEISSIVDNIRALSGDGVSFATQLLGFLIAGFTIFATVTRVEVFERLAKVNYKNTTALKYIFYCFMIVFIHYVLFLILCVVLKVLFLRNGAGSAVVYFIMNRYSINKEFLVYPIMIIISIWFVYATCLLKSFVMNVYTCVLLVIAAGSSDNN